VTGVEWLAAGCTVFAGLAVIVWLLVLLVVLDIITKRKFTRMRRTKND